MAITTIPWDDGSGDNIYLSYPAASGAQTVQVTSDANAGASRSKTVVFESGVGGLRRELTVSQGGGPNYLISGEPIINGNILTPSTPRGFIYTPEAFDPGDGVSWAIETRIILNTNIAWRDFVSFVNADGSQVRAFACQQHTNVGSRRYGLFASNNGTSWNILNNSPYGTMYAGTWRKFRIECTYVSGRYSYRMGYPDSSDWSGTQTRDAHPTYGLHVAFGGGYANNAIDGNIDLSYCKIFIGGVLWWSAIK